MKIIIKIIRSFEALNKIYKVDYVEISREYLKIKLEKLNHEQLKLNKKKNCKEK